MCVCTHTCMHVHVCDDLAYGSFYLQYPLCPSFNIHPLPLHHSCPPSPSPSLFPLCFHPLPSINTHTHRLLSRTEILAADLQNESDLLGKFYSELEDLQLWVSDTKSMLGSGSHSNGVVKSTTALTSVAQLRGKHQVRD